MVKDRNGKVGSRVRQSTIIYSVTEKFPGKQNIQGKMLDLPPILLGKYGDDLSKKTVLVYGHYDVQPALKSDGWTHDPWTLVRDEKHRLNGRGSTDDKVDFLY